MDISFKDYLLDSSIYSMVNIVVDEPGKLNDQQGITLITGIIKGVKTKQLNFGEQFLRFFNNVGNFFINGTRYIVNGDQFRKRVTATIERINNATKVTTVATKALTIDGSVEVKNGRNALFRALKKMPAFKKCQTLEEALLRATEIKKITILELENTSNLPMVIPPEIGNFSGLEKLCLNKLGLKSLPSEIGKLENLTELVVSNNELTALPEELGLLTKLTSLDVCHNNLSTLPISIGNLTNLTTLEVSHNELNTLPQDIAKLTALERLNLRGNALQKLPEGEVRFKGHCMIFIDETAKSVADSMQKLFPAPSVIFYS